MPSLYFPYHHLPLNPEIKNQISSSSSSSSTPLIMRRRSLSSCYSEHAIKVSDSYCSGPLNNPLRRSAIIAAPPAPNSVTCVYKSTLASHKQLLITITWCNYLLEQGLIVGISDRVSELDPFCRQLRLRKKKGAKAFRHGELGIEVAWDLSAAVYDHGPEAVKGFYVVVMVDSEIGLILGDMGGEMEVKRLTLEAPAGKVSLISRNEHFSGSKVYSTRAQFSSQGLPHDVTIKCSRGEEWLRNPLFALFVDGKRVLEVKRLRWNFRGNQTIFVDGMLVDMMWDLRDWFFEGYNPRYGYGIFMLRTRSGLDSRLWLEEEKGLKERAEFSLLICATKNPD